MFRKVRRANRRADQITISSKILLYPMYVHTTSTYLIIYLGRYLFATIDNRCNKRRITEKRTSNKATASRSNELIKRRNETIACPYYAPRTTGPVQIGTPFFFFAKYKSRSRDANRSEILVAYIPYAETRWRTLFDLDFLPSLLFVIEPWIYIYIDGRI